MSQQVNLIIPDLLPRQDWLDLRWVLLAAGFFAVVTSLLSWNVRRELQSVERTRISVQVELESLQKMVGEMNRGILERKPDPVLLAEVARQREGLASRELALRLLAEGRAGSTQGFSGLMAGFSRQVMEGVWLTGFEFAGKNVEIRGRLRDYSLLPAYIRRLNAEDVFHNYRFSALDMKGAEPKDEKLAANPGGVPAKSASPAVPAFTEFVLRSSDQAGAGSEEAVQ